MKGQYIRGLVKFITDIRNLRTDEEKEFRIKEEIAKIRVSFASPRLTDYDKKKNLLKLLYIQMLGFDIELGYLESVQLMASTKLSDKATGYMGCEILLRDYEEVMRLCINTTVEDLNDPCEHVCSLALTFIANSHSLEMNEKLSNEVIKMSMRFTSENVYLRKKLHMCLLRIYKLNPQLYTPNEWFSMVYHILQSETTIDCLLSICNLLEPILKLKPQNWEMSIDRLVSFLWEIAKDEVPCEHTYFTISSPWLTIKILSIFSSITPPPNSDFLPLLSNSFKILLDKTSNLVITRLGHKENNRTKKLMNLSIYMTKTGILRETIRAVVNWFPYLDNISPQYICNCIRHLYTSVMSQVRLVALEIIEDVIKIRETFEFIKSDAEFIIHFLNDSDPTIKKRCCLILCGLCDANNWEYVVPELISTLRYSELSIQEYMVPLICETLEKNLPKNDLYIDLLFKIIIHAPLISIDAISSLLLSALYGESSKFKETVVEKCLFYLQDDSQITESLLRICAYVLGDYGYMSTEFGLTEQLKLFEKYFTIASSETKCVIVTAYGKFASRDNALLRPVEQLLEQQISSTDVNLQTRACEMLKLIRTNLALFNALLKVLSEKHRPPKREKAPSSRASSRASDRDGHIGSARDGRKAEAQRDSSRTNRQNTDPRDHRDPYRNGKESARDSHKTRRDTIESKDASSPRGSGLFSNAPCQLLTTDFLRVDLEQAYKNQLSKVLVRLTNLSKQPFHLYGCTLKSPPELQGQEHNQLREIVIKAGQTVNHKLSFTLMNEVTELPKYVIELSIEPKGEDVRHTLQLPVTVHKFMSPVELEPAAFTRLWNTLEQVQPFVVKFNGDMHTLANSLGSLNFDVVKTGDNIYVSGFGLKSKESTEFYCLGMFTLDRRGGLVVSYRATSSVLAQCIINYTKVLLRQF
ncbi:alpha adaptin [Theileria orientalis strain Shintoku]|uniref:AP-2 complex subunit alpha n=1 Tax=Theileria orientalis strain Shintoku TaxID=869250 RepID=J4C8V4_THEOR|nr:alpha adaptin [Theileria orientalis strain Shintoku]PVC53775.1 alpha adaptin [Theileria orientalis]BAM41443.1 alpha adaptin [Theileria orientalis strain Shintoku]|eukprot:XP_009691744.1 alpha adaptin [Theileria orientalis strain Shintoku]